MLGAIIELGNCLNLAEPESLQILSEAYKGLVEIAKQANIELPKNQKNNRALDCAVFKYVHESRKTLGHAPYTIRCPFSEGKEIYAGSSFSTKDHIQICVLNLNKITGYFLPRPILKYNPHLIY